MKMFRNLSIFVLTFLSILVVGFYGCHKEATQVMPKLANAEQNLQVELRACDQPTYQTALIATQPLFKFRFAVACYRVFSRSYQDFHSRSNGNLPAKFFSSDLVRLGIPEAQPIIVPLAAAIRNVEYGRTDAWSAITELILQANTTMNNGQKEILTRKMNIFDDVNSGFGTYTILFMNGWDYVGKSIVKNDILTRVIASSTKENCPGGTTMNKAFNGGKDNSPVVADTQYAESVAGSTASRQSFKEEAVKMFVGNYFLLGKPGNIRTTYNEKASPGVNYIKNDGF